MQPRKPWWWDELRNRGYVTNYDYAGIAPHFITPDNPDTPNRPSGTSYRFREDPDFHSQYAHDPRPQAWRYYTFDGHVGETFNRPDYKGQLAEPWVPAPPPKPVTIDPYDDNMRAPQMSLNEVFVATAAAEQTMNQAKDQIQTIQAAIAEQARILYSDDNAGRAAAESLQESLRNARSVLKQAHMAWLQLKSERQYIIDWEMRKR